MRAAKLVPDAIIFNAAITACGRAGQYDQSLSLLKEMRRAGITPTEVSFGAVISACEQGGHWEHALSLLDEMRREGLPPDMSSLRAAMQVLVAAQELDVAFVLLRQVQEAPFSQESQYVIHHILLSACRQSSDPRAVSLQATMRELGLSAPSIPVVACFAIGDEEREHVNGSDSSDLAVEKLFTKICEQTAYTPIFDALPLDFVQRATEAEQVRSLTYHAEKKVLASLLHHDAPELEMRVNVKVCADCHSFLSHAAELLGRSILVTEPTRQHSFKKMGGCSCNGRAYLRPFSTASARVPQSSLAAQTPSPVQPDALPKIEASTPEEPCGVVDQEYEIPSLVPDLDERFAPASTSPREHRVKPHKPRQTHRRKVERIPKWPASFADALLIEEAGETHGLEASVPTSRGRTPEPRCAPHPTQAENRERRRNVRAREAMRAQEQAVAAVWKREEELRGLARVKIALLVCALSCALGFAFHFL